MAHTRYFLASLSFALLALFPGGSQAGQTVTAEDRFRLMDADGDGKLEWKEFSEINTNITRKGFDTIDSSKDGRISLEEWLVFSSNHGGDMVMPGSKGMMPPAEVKDPQEPTAPKMPLVRPPEAPQADIHVPGGPSVPGVPDTAQPNQVPEPGAPKRSTPPLITPPANPAAPASQAVKPVPLVKPPVKEELPLTPSRS